MIHQDFMIQLSLKEFNVAFAGNTWCFWWSGKGSLPKWRKATKLVVQMVLHFFLYVFIYLHFGKLIDIAMEWVL